MSIHAPPEMPPKTPPAPADPCDAAPYRNQASQRVLAVLSALGNAPSHGVSDLARSLGMTKNMVFRALATLEAAGYAVRDSAAGRYRLGYRVLALPAADAEFDIRAMCRPTLEQLHALTGESVFLSIVVGRARVNVDWIEARGRRVSHGQRGRAVPLHCTVMSRALLACLGDAEIAAYLTAAAPLDRHDALFPETAGASAADIWADIARLRRDGAIAWRNPRQYGAGYVALPIRDGAGRPHALITVGGPLERFSEARQRDLMPAIRAILLPVQQQCARVPAAPVILDGAP